MYALNNGVETEWTTGESNFIGEGEDITPPFRPVRGLNEAHLKWAPGYIWVKSYTPLPSEKAREYYSFTSYPHLGLHGRLKGKFTL
jgi:hypothetical protein